MQELLTTYKFYDNRKRRLSIFGEYYEGHVGIGQGENRLTGFQKGLRIIVFTCSKQDTFSKKTARALYLQYKFESKRALDGLTNPQVFFVPCNKNETKVPFMEFCKKNFKKQKEFTFYLNGLLVGIKVTKNVKFSITENNKINIKFLE